MHLSIQICCSLIRLLLLLSVHMYIVHISSNNSSSKCHSCKQTLLFILKKIHLVLDIYIFGLKNICILMENIFYHYMIKCNFCIDLPPQPRKQCDFSMYYFNQFIMLVKYIYCIIVCIICSRLFLYTLL